MFSWLKSLFEKKRTRTILARDDVQRIERNIDAYSRDTLCEYYNISLTTYYKVKNGKHRYSTIKR